MKNLTIMRITKILISFILIVVFCQCKTIVSNKQNTIIEFEKMKCGGSCQVFTFKILSNGRAYYLGTENVEMLGTYKSMLNDEQLDGIIREFDSVGFFEFEDSYKSNMMDLQTKFVTYRKGGLEKRIKVYDNIPKKLKSLISKLDDLIESLKWTKAK